MSERISKDQYYLGIAESVGKRATCMRRKYGAVIVSKNDTIVSTGYNGASQLHRSGVLYEKLSRL